MSYMTTKNDIEFEARVDNCVLIEGSAMNGIELSVIEPDIPYKRLHSAQILDLAIWLIGVAKERAEDELHIVEREALKEIEGGK